MSNFRYILEKGSKKHICPNCNRKEFVRYIDTETGEYIPIEFGRCDRQNNCQYHKAPKAPKRPTLCYFVPFDTMDDYSAKAIQIKQVNEAGTIKEFIPKSTIFETMDSGLYVAEYYLKDFGNKRNKPIRIQFDETNSKAFSSDGAGAEIVVSSTKVKTPQKARKRPKLEYFDREVFKRTLGNYEKNGFIQNLLKNVPFPFPVPDVERVISLYWLGTYPNSKAITFPFIDVNGKVHTIQVKTFDQSNHTIKKGNDWLHSELYKYYREGNKSIPDWLTKYYKSKNEYGSVNCLFGEHLLKLFPYNPVALVEAPKTAIYGTLYFGFPDDPKNFIWLAIGSKSYFNFKRIKRLKGRKVVVFPDLSNDGSTFQEWEQKAKDFEKRLPNTIFRFSDMLERLAPAKDRKAGNDIADFLIKEDWRKFRNEEPTQPEPEPMEPEPAKGEFDLMELATTLIGERNSEFKTPLLRKISDHTGADETESHTILKRLREEKIISVDYYGQYHLFHSTPF